MPACPRDRSTLSTQRIQLLERFGCDVCAGVWLPGDLVRKVIGELPRARLGRGEGSSATASIRCPTDKSCLAAVHFRGVEIDYCERCGGVWLDAGELDRIVKWRSDGLEVGNILYDGAGMAVDTVTSGVWNGVWEAVFEFIAEAFSSF